MLENKLKQGAHPTYICFAPQDYIQHTGKYLNSFCAQEGDGKHGIECKPEFYLDCPFYHKMMGFKVHYGNQMADRLMREKDHESGL